MKSRKNLSIGIICILLLAIVSGCGSSGIDEADNIEKVSSSDFDVNIDETENTSLEQIEKVCNLVKNFFDTTQEYPINTDIYNAEMDKEYKVAFLEYIFNKEPMTYYVYRGDEAVPHDTFRYTFVDDIGINSLIVKKDFIRAVVSSRDFWYWYLDYDGDGLPEFIVDAGGITNPYVYKYNPDKKCASLYFAGGSHNWHFLNSQTLYCNCKDNLILSRYNTDGNEIINIKFIVKEIQNAPKYWIRYYNQENADNIIEESVYVDEENWNELKALFYETLYAAPSLTFEEVFGDFADPYINIEEWN